MSTTGAQPTFGTSRRVVDLVVDLLAHRSYRQAQLQLAAHQQRNGLAQVAELIGQITEPPPGVDPRTEAQARLNLPPLLPTWLVAAVNDEIGRICARQSVRDHSVTHLLARIVAASIVDESAPAHEELGGFAARAHVDLRDDDLFAPGDDGLDATIVDVSNGRGTVRRDPDHQPDRSLTDWLGRRT